MTTGTGFSPGGGRGLILSRTAEGVRLFAFTPEGATYLVNTSADPVRGRQGGVDAHFFHFFCSSLYVRFIRCDRRKRFSTRADGCLVVVAAVVRNTELSRLSWLMVK